LIRAKNVMLIFDGTTPPMTAFNYYFKIMKMKMMRNIYIYIYIYIVMYAFFLHVL
jgi:hypothetical protein